MMRDWGFWLLIGFNALLALAMILWGLLGNPSAFGAEPDPLAVLLRAIRQVENSGTGDHDKGKAIPPYEIHEDYWTDSRVPGRWEDCRSEPYARRVVLAYWARWEPDALARADAEVLARCHNGGCNWRQKPSRTDAYWQKVRAAMEGRP